MSDKFGIDALLGMVPLYVNGTLGTEEKRAFEAALEETPELSDELDRERALQARFAAEMDDAIGGSDVSDARVHNLIGGSKSSAPENGSSGLASALSFLNPANWNPAVTFALAAAAVGQTAYISSQSSTISGLESDLDKANYQLASGKGNCDEEATIILEPSGDTGWAALNELLSAEGLTITNGGQAGPLMVKHKEDEDLDAILERLNASEWVSSAVEAS